MISEQQHHMITKTPRGNGAILTHEARHHRLFVYHNNQQRHRIESTTFEILKVYL